LDAGEEVDDDELKQIDAQELEQEEGEEEEEEFDLEDIADVPEFTLEEIDGVSVSTVDVQERLGAGSSIDGTSRGPFHHHHGLRWSSEAEMVSGGLW
jgi:hypothetical protein